MIIPIVNIDTSVYDSGEVEYINTFNDKRYGHDLKTVSKALTEIIQNTLDASDEYYYETGNRVEPIVEYDGGRGIFFNYGKSISVIDLRDGGSSKDKDIDYCLPRGYFGTGFDKAIGLLLSRGYSIEIYTGHGMIRPVIKRMEVAGKSADFIVLEYRKVNVGVDFTCVVVDGISESEFNEAIGNFLEYNMDKYAIVYGKYVKGEAEIMDKKEKIGGYVEVLIRKVIVDENSTWWEFFRKYGITGGIGYFRGIVVDRYFLARFDYNFCDREVMVNDSRNSFTGWLKIKLYVGKIWAECDNYDAIKEFIKVMTYNPRYSEDCHEKHVVEFKPRHKDIWLKAWKDVYGTKGITCNQTIYDRNSDNFVLVNEWLYNWLKMCGVPTEYDVLGVKDVYVVEYNMNELERCMVKCAIDIAAIVSGDLWVLDNKPMYKVMDIKYALDKHLVVFEELEVLNYAGGVDYVRDAFGCIIRRNINEIYLDKKVFEREDTCNVGFIASTLIHEIGHAYGYGDGNMDMYYGFAITKMINMNLEFWYNKAVEMFGEKVKEYWEVVLNANE